MLPDALHAPPAYQQQVFSSGDLGEAVHTVRLVATGEKRAGARNAYVTFDALLVD